MDKSPRVKVFLLFAEAFLEAMGKILKHFLAYIGYQK